MAALWNHVADDLQWSESPIKTTGNLRSLLQHSGFVYWRTSHKAWPPGLPAEIDKVMLAQLGADDVPLDAAKRQAAADTFRALAVACAK